jgi:hypothetical protein
VLNLANTPGGVSVLRSQDVDAYGDIIDGAVPVYENVPASIVESGHVTTDPATQQPRTIRTVTCVMPQWADVENTDRLQGPDGTIWAIIEVTAIPTLGYPADKVLKLRRVTAAGV